jgi:PTS system ascorbate-specific IIC component
MGNQILYFVKDFFSSAGLIVGIFALVGSILLRRTPLKTAVSTVTTVLGFFILSAGGAAIGASLTHFTGVFSGLVNAQGSTAVIAASDTWAISVLNAQSNVASTASIMLLLVIFFNLLLAKTSSFKNIYLSTHIEMYLCIAFATLFQITGVKIGIDHYQAYIAILCGAGLIAIYATLAPSLTTHSAYLLMNERNINLCHHGLFAFGLSNAIGTLIGKMKKGRYTSCEKINMPRWMSFLKDSNISLVLVMVLIFLVIYIAG